MNPDPTGYKSTSLPKMFGLGPITYFFFIISTCKTRIGGGEGGREPGSVRGACSGEQYVQRHRHQVRGAAGGEETQEKVEALRF